ncbi:MAG: DMT family transporter, partial [Candidatus Aminicenantales bacterium]
MKVSKPTPGISPVFVLVLGVLAVSTSSIFIRFAQNNAPSLVIAAYRLTLASLLLSPIALFRQRTVLFSLTPGEMLLALVSGFFLALHFASFITSLEYTTVASSVVLSTSTPLWVALLAPVILKEPMNRHLFIGMVLALVGSSIVGLSDTCALNVNGINCPPLENFLGDQSLFGNFLALFAAWMAVGYIMIGRRLRSKISLVSYIFLVYGMAALVLLLVMFLAGQTPLGYPSQTYLWLVLLALVPQLLGHSSYNWALGHLSATYVSIAIIGEPIGSTILAYFLLEETPAALKIFGAILILVGIYLASHSP